ncbi:hypothetical protein QQF64_015811 [Cirrhinus molitorella]|uniref:Uncharacterized protein n=1 Tax=Cirrhinus molitorella TaxID=172907 RepID=A0ABR3LL13_9TELE
MMRREEKMRQSRTRPLLCRVRNVFSCFLSSSRPSHREHARSPVRRRSVTGSGAPFAIFRPPRTDSPLLPTGALSSLTPEPPEHATSGSAAAVKIIYIHR